MSDLSTAVRWLCAAFTLLLAGEAWALDEAALRAQLLAHMESLGCPGALVAIDRRGKPPLRWALGVADVSTRQPMTLDMHMRIGSLSKMFVGTTALRLADAGRLSLDAPVSRYLPGLPYDGDLTVRMLGQHTTGLFNAIEAAEFRAAIAKDPGRRWTSGEILAFALPRSVPPADGPRFRYSNTNTVVLARVIESVAKKPLALVVREQVTRPLGLRSVGFTPAAGLPKPHPRGYRNGKPEDPVGYGDRFFDATGYSASWTGAAGDMYATLDTMARATRPLATGALLSGKQRMRLHDWIDTPKPDLQYGFHLFRQRDGLGHPGDVPGFSATAVYVPALDVSIVVLTNLSNSADKKTPAVELEALVLSALGAR